jgi:branched-chain amino acid transport system ATP-binding protein
LWRKASSFKPVTEKARECLEAVGLAHRAATAARNLAHGEKRKLEIALLLAGDPAVLLLDEPMAGVSAEDVPELVGVIKSLAGGVLMVEHHMEVILQVADRIAVMHHGALLACDTPAAVMANPVVQEAYLGEEL